MSLSLLNCHKVLIQTLLPRWTLDIKFPSTLPQMFLELLERGQNNTKNDFFSDNGILLAAPKKKVSHQKKRQKLYAPGSKQLKMIHHLNKCPSCGHYKRANTLCMHCVNQIRFIWKSYTRTDPVEPPQEKSLSDLDKRVLYPGKKDTEYVRKLKDKDSYLERRIRSLPVDGNE